MPRLLIPAHIALFGMSFLGMLFLGMSIFGVAFFGVANPASASGTHVVRGQVYACKTIEKYDALTAEIRRLRALNAFLDIRSAANAGDCQLFLSGDPVFLQSRRSAQHVCVRPVGKPDCFWLAESHLRGVPNRRPPARR